jgi:hypothetical protein
MGWDNGRPWWVGPPFFDPQLGVGRSQEEECTWHLCEIDVDSMRASLLNLFWSLTGFQLLRQHETTCSWNILELLIGIVVVRWWLGPKWIQRTLETFRLAARSLKLWNCGDNVFFLNLHFTSDTSHVSFSKSYKHTVNLHYCTSRLREYFVCFAPGPHPLEFSARREYGRWTWLSNHIVLV